MADNVIADAGSGGATFATDEDVGNSRHFPGTKVMLGADGVFTAYWNGDVTNAGTFLVQEDGAALTALQLIDDIVYVDDTATHATGTSKGAGIMAAATPTDVSIDANDIGMLAMSLDRRLHVDADITASVALDVSAATITVNAHAVTNAGTFLIQEDGAALTALQLIDDTVFVDDTDTHTAATTKVLGIGAVAVPTDTIVEANDIGMPAMSVDRRLLIDADITSSVALDVSAATITVNAHAVTNAGAFLVQEDGAALTALQLIGDIVHIDDTATHATGTTKGAGIMAAATPTDPSVTANDIGMLAMSLDRRLHVDADITASVALDVSAATITVNTHAVTNAVLTAWDETNRGAVNTIAGQIGVQGLSGADTALTQRVSLATDIALPAGTNAIGKLAVNDGVDIGDVTLNAGTASIGTVGITPATSGGYSVDRSLSAASNNATSVKASAGQCYGYTVSSTASSVRFLKLYNKASAPAPATDNGLLVMTIPIPFNTNGTTGHVEFLGGIEFTTGIAFAIVGAVGDTDNSSISANEIVLNLMYA